MTGLLVSVRSAAEAEIALAGGADVIDIKEPDRGALGAADPAVWQAVLRVVNGRAITSAALGELHTDNIAQLVSHASGFNFAKIGLSAWRSDPHSAAQWHRTRSALPTTVRAVPVMYADVKLAGFADFSSAAL